MADLEDTTHVRAQARAHALGQSSAETANVTVSETNTTNETKPADPAAPAPAKIDSQVGLFAPAPTTLERVVNQAIAFHEREHHRRFALFITAAAAAVLAVQGSLELSNPLRVVILLSHAPALAIAASYARLLQKTSVDREWLYAFSGASALMLVAQASAFGLRAVVVVFGAIVSMHFAKTSNRRISLGVVPALAALHLAAASLFFEKPSLSEALLTLVAYAIAFAIARLESQSVTDALAHAANSGNEFSRREAQMVEANRDVDQLLQLNVGRVGRYTGMAAGSYVLGELIGRGAMAEVYAARSTANGPAAAIKLLQPHMLSDENLVLRFLREGEAVSALRAEHIVSIFEVGKIEEGAPYIAMELLRGHDLGWHLKKRVRLPLEEVVALALQVAEGLDVARGAGIVHRDLKPPNLFLAQQSRAAPIWKILDFGVSRLVHSSGTLTQDGVVGTPGYMSPEQAGGQAATHQSDVFSLGAVIYRALTGDVPFSGPDTPQILYQVVYSNPKRPSKLVPELPSDVDLVLAIALAKDKDDRFQSGRDLAKALKDASTSSLDPALRLQGRTLLAALPWGASTRSSIVDLQTPLAES